jgi:UDP-glucose 4-epimerase
MDNMPYQGRRVLITGGLGFIGSNLAIGLVEQGARVVIADSCVEGCGSNLYNIDDVAGRVTTVTCSIADTGQLAEHIRHADVVFNLAGEISHIHSMLSPDRDLRLNSVDQLRFLRACRQYAPGIRVVYAGTRQVYGKPKYLPVDEQHPVNPLDFNGIHKYAAESYHRLLTETGGIDAITLRLTNVYGPRMALNLPCQDFLGTFIRRSLFGSPLEVFGDGSQLRDPVFVDDVVDAFLLAGIVARPESRIYNVGGPEPLSLREISEITAAAGGRSEHFLRSFPEHLQGIDIGSYWTNSERIGRELGWKPEVRFADGIHCTIQYYRPVLSCYLDPQTPQPICSLPMHVARESRQTAVAGA